MIIKRGTGIEERERVKGKEKWEQNLTWTLALSVALFPFSRYPYSFPVLVIRSPFPVPRSPFLVLPFSNHHCPNDNFSLLTNKKVMQNFIKTATSAKENCSRISRRRPPKCEELVFAHGGGRSRSFPRRSGNTWRECTACNFQVKLYVNPCCFWTFFKNPE